jgi:hypothetical protein
MESFFQDEWPQMKIYEMFQKAKMMETMLEFLIFNQNILMITLMTRASAQNWNYEVLMKSWIFNAMRFNVKCGSHSHSN